MNANTQTTFASQVSKSGKRFFASITVGSNKTCFVWPEVLRAILDDPDSARALLAEIDNLNGVATTATVIETLATPIPAATVASPAPVVVAVSEPIAPKDTRPAKTPSVHTGTGADIITKSKIDRDASNASIKAALVAEYKELGVKGTGNPTFCKVETLRSRIAAHKATESHVVTQPTIAAAVKEVQEIVSIKVSAPADPVDNRSTRHVIGDCTFKLTDGREAYTCVYSDGSSYTEIFQTHVLKAV